MSKKPKESNRPSHAIWQVSGDGEKSRWNRIGSAWMHKDAKGANLIFDSIPLSGRVVVREITEQDEADEQFNEASQGGQQ